jgi:putative transcriptional regulator
MGFFSKTVVFLYEDTPAGTAGIVLNKPGNLWLSDLARNAGREYPRGINAIYTGGPVNERAIMMLHTDDWQSQNTLHTGVGINISSDSLMIDKILDNNTPRKFRIFTGASIWAPGQLDFEIRRNSWLVAPLTPDLVFDLDGETQWNCAIERAGKEIINHYF